MFSAAVSELSDQAWFAHDVVTSNGRATGGRRQESRKHLNQRALARLDQDHALSNLERGLVHGEARRP
jgi:hypothetical protein